MEPNPPVQVLTEAGGFASHGELVERSGRRAVELAVAAGEIVRLGRGRYALPTYDVAAAAAVRLGGVVSHLSAAAYWEWETLDPPRDPWVCVPRGRKLTTADRRRVRVHWRPLDADVLGAGVTDKVTTVLDCARDLALPDALAVIDQALRSGLDHASLVEAAAALRGAGSARIRARVALGDRRAANAFESGVRAHAVAAGLDVVPQQPIRVGGATYYPDLLDTGRALVIEADSWTHHGKRAQFNDDLRRYDNLVLLGYRVLRFTRDQVIDEPDWVARSLGSAATGDVAHLMPREPTRPEDTPEDDGRDGMPWAEREGPPPGPWTP